MASQVATTMNGAPLKQQTKIVDNASKSVNNGQKVDPLKAAVKTAEQVKTALAVDAPTDQQMAGKHLITEMTAKQWLAIDLETGKDPELIAKKMNTPEGTFLHVIIVKGLSANAGFPRGCQKLAKGKDTPHGKGAAFFIEIKSTDSAGVESTTKYNICKSCYNKKSVDFTAKEFSPIEIVKHDLNKDYPRKAPTDSALTEEQRAVYQANKIRISEEKQAAKNKAKELSKEAQKLESLKKRTETKNAAPVKQKSPKKGSPTKTKGNESAEPTVAPVEAPVEGEVPAEPAEAGEEPVVPAAPVQPVEDVVPEQVPSPTKVAEKPTQRKKAGPK